MSNFEAPRFLEKCDVQKPNCLLRMLAQETLEANFNPKKCSHCEMGFDELEGFAIEIGCRLSPPEELPKKPKMGDLAGKTAQEIFDSALEHYRNKPGRSKKQE